MSPAATQNPRSRKAAGKTAGVSDPVLPPARPPTYLLAQPHQANSCFFRSGAAGDGRKALVQITERCNLHCAHCFVSAVREGSDMDPVAFRDLIIPRLLDARVRRITLTGGEPFAHPAILDFCTEAVAVHLSVAVCTNATTVSDEQIAYLTTLNGVHVNVSFDGFSVESHGKFRGAPEFVRGDAQNGSKARRRRAAAGHLVDPKCFDGTRRISSTGSSSRRRSEPIISS